MLSDCYLSIVAITTMSSISMFVLVYRVSLDFFQAFYILLFTFCSLVNLYVCFETDAYVGSGMAFKGKENYLIISVLLIQCLRTFQDGGLTLFDECNHGYLSYTI
jgi:hypothetical protein